MVERKHNDAPATISTEAGGDAGPDNTLLPMLVGGLVLIVVGAIVVMMFV